MILGTAAYMSPEQARGRPAHKRSDVWSFGCVVYEILAGRQAFARETVSETIAVILEKEPEWTALQSAPAALQMLVRWCLTRNPKDRLQAIGDGRHLLSDEHLIAVTHTAPTSSQST
jgi:serine/threonine protein kinase